MTKNGMNGLNLNGLDHKLVREEDIDPTKGMVYNPGEGEVNLVNVDEMLSKVAKILEVMCEDEMILLKETDYPKYEEKMEERFEEFAFRYFAIFKKVISGEDITPLFRMLTEIDKIHRGDKEIEQVEKELGEELANQYIYPKVGKGKKSKKNKNKRK